MQLERVKGTRLTVLAGVLSRRRRGRWRRVLAAAGLPAALSVGGVLPALVHDVPVATSAPSRILCDGFRSCDARGYSSYHYGAHEGTMFWRMFAGNNCTNYVAFVEATVYHVREPSYLLGNGGQWAGTAAAHGVLVNRTPSVGSVGVWFGGAPGMGPLGHVAVVEEVGPKDSYIVISQDAMGGEANGFDWVLINKRNPTGAWQTWPDRFIHFRIPVRADVGYFAAKSDTVSLRYSQTHGPANYTGTLPAPPGSSVVPLVGDWRGTGLDGFGFYNPQYGMFHLLAARTSKSGPVNVGFVFGPLVPGMIPLVGDWTGGGSDGVGYYDPATGTFYLRQSLSAGPADQTFVFGPPHMIPLVGDWTGGRKDEVGFYNPAKGTFTLEAVLGSAKVYRSFAFGPAHMMPVVGNWDVGAGESVGYYDPRTGIFYLRVALSHGPANEVVRFGPPHMTPLTGDWFGQYRRP